MDLYSAIRELHDEKRKLDYAIAALEARQTKVWTPTVHKRRGRKGMSREERIEVSKRMRAYWAARRNGGVPPQSEIANRPDAGASQPVSA